MNRSISENLRKEIERRELKYTGGQMDETYKEDLDRVRHEKDFP